MQNYLPLLDENKNGSSFVDFKVPSPVSSPARDGDQESIGGNVEHHKFILEGMS